MAKVTREWLEDDLRLQITGMQSDIIRISGAVDSLEYRVSGAELNIEGLTSSVSSLENRMTGAESDIAGLTSSVADHEARITGLELDSSFYTAAIHDLEDRMSGAESNISGLTGAVDTLEDRMSGAESDILGLSASVDDHELRITGLEFDSSFYTAAIYDLENRMSGAESDISGLTASVYQNIIDISGLTTAVNDVENLLFNLDASDVGFVGTTGLDVPDVEQALIQLNSVVGGLTSLIGISGTGSTGADGITGPGGITGHQGETGYRGITGPGGITGPYGVTGSEGPQGTTGVVYSEGAMTVDVVSGVTGSTSSSTYMPITGLQNTFTLQNDAQVLTLMSVRAVRPGPTSDHQAQFRFVTAGYTGQELSVYIDSSDYSRTQGGTLHYVTPLLSAGTYNAQGYWKTEASTILADGILSSVVLEGVRGETGLPGITGIKGDPGSATGYQGITGIGGITGPQGIGGPTGPGIVSTENFSPIVPLEGWIAHNVSQVRYNTFIPVLEFDNTTDTIEKVVPIPTEWDQSGDITVRIASILSQNETSGDSLKWRLDYGAFNDAASITPSGFTIHSVYSTATLPSGGADQYDFVEQPVFTLSASNLVNNNYLYLRLRRDPSGDDVGTVGLVSADWKYPVSLAQGVTGVGYVGSDGATGAVGTTGLKGAQGDTGFQGETGAGITGPFGFTGLRGPTGYQGETGARGFTGLGVTGLQGETGAEGPTGFQGVTGPTGKGETGLQGVTGIYGDTGIQGETGAKGDTGSKGDVGLKGDTGAQGPSLETGVINLSIDGGNNEITTGVKTDISLPYDIQLYQWRVLNSSGVTGSISFGLWESTYSNFPPTAADAMHVGSTGPYVKDIEIKREDSDLSDWGAPTGSAGSIIRVNVIEIDSITKASLSLFYKKI